MAEHPTADERYAEWGGQVDGVASRTIDVPHADAYDPETADAAAARAAGLLDEVELLVAELDDNVPGLVAQLTEAGDGGPFAATASRIAELRRKLALTLSSVEHAAGVAFNAGRVVERQGILPDGRPWTIRAGNARKAWDHTGWQRTVREGIVSSYDGWHLVRPDGTLVEDAREVIGGAIAVAQTVHGSTAPKVTALREHGLDPDDYAETTPGPWSIEVQPPAVS